MNYLNSVSVVVLATLIIGLVSGCGDDSSGATTTSEQKIAIVSYAEVAKETGLSDQLQKAISQQVNRDTQLLQQGIAKMNSEFEAKRQEYGDTPTEEQLNELKQMQNVIALQKNQGEQRIKQNQYMLQQRMGATLREQVRPIAMEIAKEQGYSIVLEHSPTVLAFSEKINISQEIVIRLNEQNLSGELKGAPGNAAAPGNEGGSKTPVIEGNGAGLDLLTNPGGDGSSKKKTDKKATPGKKTEEAASKKGGEEAKSTEESKEAKPEATEELKGDADKKPSDESEKEAKAEKSDSGTEAGTTEAKKSEN